MIFLPEIERTYGNLNNLMWASEGPCFRCGAPTVVLDILFEAHLCPDCFTRAWDEYQLADIGFVGQTMMALGAIEGGIGSTYYDDNTVIDDTDW